MPGTLTTEADEIAALVSADWAETIAYNPTGATFAAAFVRGSVNIDDAAQVGGEQVHHATLYVATADYVAMTAGQTVTRDADGSVWCILRVYPAEYGQRRVELQTMVREAVGRF